MALSMQRTPRNHDQFPTTQLFLLAAVRLAEPIALTSIFPYAWPLVKKFNVGDEHHASFYAGLLISAFSLAESMTGMYWGSLSDRIGRRPVLLIGCFGTILSMVMVGFASNIWVALIGRTVGGLLNGNIGVIQTMVGEIVTKPEHEPRAYSVMPFVWSIGTVIGPSIGGTFADPVTNFPGVFSSTGLFARFPYLLPNLLCMPLLLISIALGYFLLEETHPDMRPQVAISDSMYYSEETPLFAKGGSIKALPVNLQAEKYGTFEGSNDTAWRNNGQVKAFPSQPRIFTKQVTALIVAMGIFAYHSMTYDHLLPIFLEDERASPSIHSIRSGLASSGGLGFGLRTVGLIMSIDGIIALFIQGCIFPICASYFGIHRLFILVSILHPLTYFIIPCVLLLPPTSALLFPAIFACLFIRNFLCILAYPVLLIMIKEATPSPSVLGRVNGLAASVGAAARTVAPPVAGYLYSVGSKSGFSGLAWWGSGLVAIIGVLQCFYIKREKNASNNDEEEKKVVIRVSVREIVEDDE